MVRTKGSGWGGGVILYQLCPFCNKKKAYYRYQQEYNPFKCVACKKVFNSDTLLRFQYAEQYKRDKANAGES